jgi:hypothetical protein
MTLHNLSEIIEILWDLCQIWNTFRKYRQERSEPSVTPDGSELSEDKTLDDK